MTETELEYQFCFNCNDRKNCYTKPKDCTRIKEEIGLQEMTNEEYLKSCNTEQLAEHLLNVWMDGAFNVNAEFGLNEAQIEKHKGYILEWLKQPHTFIDY